jgi:hypothetical protein
VAEWPHRRRWLARTTDAALLGAFLRRAGDLVRHREERVTDAGWEAVGQSLRLDAGLSWEVDADDAVAALVAGCDGSVALRVLLAVLADALGRPLDDVAAAALPVVRDLVARGILGPPAADAG